LPLAVYYSVVGDFPCRNNLLLWFDVRGTLPTDAVIESARLQLDLLGGSGPDPANRVVLVAYRITSPWEESSVTWLSQPTTTESDLAAAEVGTAVSSTSSWDVTAIAQGWYSGGYPQYGLLLRPVNLGVRFAREFINPRLTVTYSSPTAATEPPATVPPVSDSIAPTVTITTDPPSPMTTTSLTVHVLAQDNLGLGTLQLKIDGRTVETVREPAPGTLVLRIDLPTELALGPHTLVATAWDLASPSPNSSAATQPIHIGTGTAPAVTVTCSPTEVLPNDGTTIVVSGSAHDPEGIRELSLAARAYPDTSAAQTLTRVFTYNPPYQTERTETAQFTNVDLVGLDAAEIPCSGVARDAELQWSDPATDAVRVVRPYQWDYGIPYHNPSRPEGFDWQVMDDVFGWDEVHNCIGDTCWRTIRARIVSDDIDHLPEHGECFGMSAYSDVWAMHEQAVDDLIQEHVGTSGFMLPESYAWRLCEGRSSAEQCTRRSVERFHAAQFSDEVMDSATDQILPEFVYGLGPWIDDYLPRLAEDLANGRYGVLGMTEERSMGSAGHAVVPWRMVGSRLYVYDPNREEASNTPFTDYENYEHYPYLEFSGSDFAFLFEAGRIWNGYLTYTPYDTAARNDYDLPDGLEYLALIFSSSDGEIFAQDETGARTGVVEGETVVEIEGSTPIPLLTAGEGLRIYALPLGTSLDFHVEGTGVGEYRWAAIAENSTYGIWGRDITPGQQDTISLGLSEDRLGYSLRLRSPRLDDDLTIGVERPAGDGSREVELASIDTDGPVDLEVHTDEEGNSLVIANRSTTGVSTAATLRSTESDSLGEYDLEVGAFEELTVEPDWEHLGNAPRISRARAWPTVSPYVVGGLVGAVVVGGLLLGGAIMIWVIRKR
jgi:hypothetical protein